MPTPIDPSLGLTATLAQVRDQQQRQQSQDRTQSSGQLERAARSLESVQGSVSGQTQAIQQMTLAARQQAQNTEMLIGQLNMQIASLSRAVGAMSMSMSVPPPQPMPPPMSMSAGQIPFQQGPGLMSRAGSMGLTAAGYAGRGGQSVLQGLGSLSRVPGALGQGLVSPFMGTPLATAAPGQFAPGLSPDAGIWRSAAMASGLGVSPEMTRGASMAQVKALGMENMREKISGGLIGAAGGLASGITSFAGMSAGYGLGGAIGGAIGGAVGLGGAGSMAGSLLLGGPLTAAITAPANMAIGEVMDQTAAIRGYGSQFARNASRFMPSAKGEFSANRRPGIAARRKFGKDVNRMEIQDLTFDRKDMTEIFAGMTQNDLIRGVSSTDDVVKRFRETKEVIKMIGRRMAQSVSEGAGVMGELQGLGFSPTSQGARAAIFGASSVQGLTPREAHNRAVDMSRGAAAGGYGKSMYGVSTLSLQAGKNAIQTGAADNVDIEALGGERGATTAMARLIESYTNTSLGRASLLAGTAGLGKSIQETISIANKSGAGAKASVAMGGGREKQAYLSNNHAAMADMYSKIREVSLQFRGQMGEEEAMTTAVGAMFPNQFNDAESRALVKVMKNLPKAVADEQRLQTTTAANDMSNATINNRAIMARTRRWFRDSWLNTAAEGLTDSADSVSGSVARGVENIGEDLAGTEKVSITRGVDYRALADMRKAASSENMFKKTYKQAPSLLGRDQKFSSTTISGTFNSGRELQKKLMSKRADKSVVEYYSRDLTRQLGVPGGSDRINKLKQDMLDASDPEDRKKAAMKLLEAAFGKDAYRSTGYAGKRAMQEILESKLGVNVAAAMVGEDASPYEKKLDKRIAGGRELLSDYFGTGVAESDALTAPELINYMQQISDQGYADEKTLAAAKKNPLFKNVENAIIGAGERWDTERDFNNAMVTMKQQRRSIAEKSATVKTDMASQFILDIARRAGKAEMLSGAKIKSGQAPLQAQGMSDILSQLTNEDLGKVKGGPDELVAKQLMWINNLGQDISAGERTQIAKRLGLNEKRDKASLDLIVEDLEAGDKSSLATGLLTGQMGMGQITTRKNRALDREEIMALKTMSTNALVMAEIVKKMARQMNISTE